MKYAIKFLIVLFFFGSVSLLAQEKQVEKGNEDFEDYSYIDARETYLKVAEEGYKSADLFKKLGDSYYYNADYVNAAKWYQQLILLEPNLESEYLYKYAQSLKSTGDYSTSDNLMEKFYKAEGGDKRAALFVKERNYLEEIEGNSGRFFLTNIGFNSELSDFAPSFYGNKLIFASNRTERSFSKRLHDWNEQPFLDLFLIDTVNVGKKKGVKRMSASINTKYHESTAAISKDGNTMFFTRNNYTNNEYKSDAAGTNLLKLYRATRENEDKKWNIVEVPFNSDEYSVAHPSLSEDEKTLYFASDMPGGKGLSDLYKVSLSEDGFGSPVNLGDKINTEGRETFPFVSSENILYFASDGHVGLGGLDVFLSEINEDGAMSETYNLGRPINSTKDDFSFIINITSGVGYFASNREGGKGFDDIYGFKRTETIDLSCDQIVNGVVLDKNSKEPIGEATVILLDGENKTLAEVISASNGAFSFPLECDKQYSARATKEGYSTAEKAFVSTSENELELDLTLDMEKGKDLDVTPIEVGSDLTKVLNLNPIYFDFDRYNIRPDAAIELQKVIAVLKEYPNMKIDVRSHTDSRGRDSYNLSLSKKRNASTIEYIITAGGINRGRVTGDGYGETVLVNGCSNGVKCEDYEHEQNRRSEFIVVAN